MTDDPQDPLDRLAKALRDTAPAPDPGPGRGAVLSIFSRVGKTMPSRAGPRRNTCNQTHVTPSGMAREATRARRG